MLQELVMVFTGRLQGQHPFDPNMGPLRTYLYMLTRSVLLNRIARRGRRDRRMAAHAANQRDRVASIDEEALCPGAPEDILGALGMPSARITLTTRSAWDRIRS